MQPYVHPFHAPVMMSMPISFGIMQGSPNKSNSPQPQMMGSPNQYVMTQPYQMVGEMYSNSMPVHNQYSAHLNQNQSPPYKKKDPSIVIIDCPTSPSIQEERKEGKKKETSAKSKAGKKLTEKREQKIRVQEDILSSTSLGNRVARSRKETLLKQSAISTPIPAHKNSVDSIPAKRNSRHSSAGSSNKQTSPDYQHHQNKHLQQQQVTIEDNNSDGPDIHECILVEDDSLEKIRGNNIIQNQIKQYQHYQQNVAILSKRTLPQNKSGFNQNVNHEDQSSIPIKQQKMVLHVQQDQQSTQLNQYFSLHKQQPQTASAAIQTRGKGINGSATSPPGNNKMSYSPPSHSEEQTSGEIQSCTRKEFQNSALKKGNTGMSMNRRGSNISIEDKTKRERKYYSRYNNEDFISGEYMYVMKRASNKRLNPVQITPSLKKKPHKNNEYSVKSSQVSLMEIINSHNLFDKQNIQKVKSSFVQSVKAAEISRAAQKAAKNAFIIPLTKKKAPRKHSDDVYQSSSYFSANPNQSFIEEQFEEDTILLVNNNNQSVEIKVNKTPLDKSANIAQKKANKEGLTVDPLSSIKNRFDDYSRNKYFSQINFIKDYKSGYAPIDIQNQQEKELDEMLKNECQLDDTHKQHFIRRKQSQNINLKRSCGVSYVKQPESKQENVSQIYERIPQLVFQCSNGQPKLLEHEYFYDKLYQKLFTSSNQWLLCAYFESEDESLMRDYLLYPEKRWQLCKGKYFVVRSVNDIWPLFIEKFFMCIHLFYDSKELIKCPSMKEFTIEEVQNIIKYSNIQLGLLFKRSINGKKAFKKSLGDAFLGDIENHPSSRDPQASKKKGRKTKQVAEEPIVEMKDEVQNKESVQKKSAEEKKSVEGDSIKRTSSTTSNDSSSSQIHMNKNQINKYFKEVKSKLKQDKFLKDLPIFKKKVEDIQKYLVPYMKKLNQCEAVFPPKEVIKSISDLETNDEKAEALLEMMEHIQEQINDEDYNIPQPQRETRQRTSARKESLQKSSTNTPVLNPQPHESNTDTFNQLLLNKDKDEKNKQKNTEVDSKNSSEIDIEIDSESKISEQNNQNELQANAVVVVVVVVVEGEGDQNIQIESKQQNNDQKQELQVAEHQDNIEIESLQVQDKQSVEKVVDVQDKIEIEQQVDQVKVLDLDQKNNIQEIEINEEKIEVVEVMESIEKIEDIEIIQEKKEEEEEQAVDIEIKEEKIEIEDNIVISEENQIVKDQKLDDINNEEIKNEEDQKCQLQEEQNEQQKNGEEAIEIEHENNQNYSSSSSSSQSPTIAALQQSSLEQIKNLQGNYLESNQNAQTFETIEKPQSPVQDTTSTSSNKFNKSPSQEKTITKEIDRTVTFSDSTAIIIEENTIQLPFGQSTSNKPNEEKEKQSIVNENALVVKNESLICKEILEYIDKDISSKNINTLSAKLELYVEEKGWKCSSQIVKSLLSTFILYAKDQFEKLALEMMNIRFGIVREENEAKLIETMKNIRFITKKSSKRKPIYENYTSSIRSKWDFHENHLTPLNISNNLFSKKEVKVNEDKLRSETEPITIGKLIDKDENYSILKRGDLSMPLYYISTRDSFAFDLIEKVSTCHFNGKSFNKIEYFFDPENHPTNFKSFVDSFPDYRVGATLYTGFFTHQELMSIEDSCYETEVKSFQRHYFPMTAQMTCTAQKIRRTKFFFGSRYIWTRQQLSEPHSFVGAGVRQDVSEPPAWMRRKVVGPLEQAGILPNGFINSLALNVYHDGKEGLAQHFDDATRFRQPIFTVKLFSDARLSFGSQLYGFCNSAFVIPMARGSVLKLEENSYAANGIKHCVRPCDMSGKNATIIMRQMHHKVVNEANIYDECVDLPTWISTLSSREDSVPYGDQKEIEANYLMRNSGQSCS